MTSGLTLGTLSSIEAVVRRLSCDKASAYTWEMLIVPGKKSTRFSDDGDSGACVFNLAGYVVGMVVGSSDDGLDADLGRKRERDEEADVTFAAPIQWVLDDIREFTGLEPRLA
ncbi:hypothetical protein F5B17DRAFT_431564 [Nemania serpens]|nr:hypothetical protein F5B17DRAFT_431564 [Nemania serpens]